MFEEKNRRKLLSKIWFWMVSWFLYLSQTCIIMSYCVTKLFPIISKCTHCPGSLISNLATLVHYRLYSLHSNNSLFIINIQVSQDLFSNIKNSFSIFILARLKQFHFETLFFFFIFTVSNKMSITQINFQIMIQVFF